MHADNLLTVDGELENSSSAWRVYGLESLCVYGVLLGCRLSIIKILCGGYRWNPLDAISSE